MTDRELLEAAAKAAGYVVLRYVENYDDYYWTGPTSGLQLANSAGIWNPLDDDGDALRLAVKLNLRFVFHPVLIQAIVKPYFASDVCWRENSEDHADHYAATRRAIVRAAAACAPSS